MIAFPPVSHAGLRPQRYWPLVAVLLLALLSIGLSSAAPASFAGAGPSANSSSLAPVASMAGKSANDRQHQPASVSASNPGAARQPRKGSKASFDGVDCSQVYALHINQQMNMRASEIMVGCGYSPGGSKAGGGGAKPIAKGIGPSYGGSDVDAVTGAEAYPNVTQAESMDWVNGSTVLINYNDSANAPGCYSGLSYSTNGGASYTRINPFCSGHGTNYGDPVVVYNAHQSKWYAGDLASGCGGQGIGLWTSTDGITWATGACAHSGTSDDREAMWVDNNGSSPHYGRMYISWNDFANSQNIMMVYSDDGTSWTPVTVYSGNFIRNQNDEGSPGVDGTVFIYAGDPSSDTIGSARTNHIFRSTDGGASWADLSLNSAGFVGPGDLDCTGGFPAQSPIWRDEGFGQMAVGPNSILHYVYEAQGSGGDPGDIYYSRSTDNGNNWSPPSKVNTDSTNRAQFKPSVAATTAGGVVISWYDRRNTSNDDYEYWSKVSTNNGVSFSPEQRTSDVVITQPQQPDPNVQPCYGGDYDYHFAAGNIVYLSWTDGRVQVSGNNQQDVFTDRITFSGGGTPTPTPTPPPSPTPQPTVCANPFSDIAGNVFFVAINTLYCHGAINGTDSSHFSPAGTSTRAQFAKVVVLGFGTPFYTPATQDFVDVPSSYFAYTFIESGYHAGILSGYDATTCHAHNLNTPCYLPNIPITRGQITKLVVNAAHYTLVTPGGQTFTDVSPTNIFYRAIETAHAKGVINGYPDNTFRPNDNVRRDAMAQIVYKGTITP